MGFSIFVTYIVAFLTIVFVILKAAGIIMWSWWLILSPIWIGSIALFSVLLGVALLYSDFE